MTSRADEPELMASGEAAGEDRPLESLEPDTGELHHPEGIHPAAEAHVDTDEAQMTPPVDDDEGADEPLIPASEHRKVVEERDDYLDQLQRARADYDNLNKRRVKEVAEARERGQAALVGSLLEALDTFSFALRAAEASQDPQLAKGVQLVHSQLVAALQQAGLEEVPGEGAPFDPAHHEALMSEPDGTERDHPEVTEVLRTGYRFKDQLLRPASVKVVE